MLKGRKIGVIGVGNMGAALIKGWLTQGLARPEQIVVADNSIDRIALMEKLHGLEGVANNAEVAARAQVLLLAVKPQFLGGVLAEIAPVMTAGHLVISIAAGVSLATLEEALPQARVVRVMPNTPTMVQEGMAAVSRGSRATADDEHLIVQLFGAVGRAVAVAEQHLDAVTGLSGSGPAYFFLMMEALADGGVKAGLPRDLALLLSAQTALGAARLLLETQDHPASLKDMVTSPGGTTIAGLHVLENGGMRGLLMSAVEAAVMRAKELARAAAGRS
jgi:pyrroline-5-carboxylate reductase